MKRAAWLLAALTACTGAIGSTSDRPNLDGPNLDGTGQRSPAFGATAFERPERPTCEGVCTGETPLTVLRRDEYRAVVEAALGAVDWEGAGLPADDAAGSFASNVGRALTQADAAAYESVARFVADQVAPRVVESLSCTVEDCGMALVDAYGSALFRRPLDDEERQGLSELYAWSLPEDGAEDAASLVLAALLASPHLLYRLERGDTDGRLNGREVGMRLAAAFAEGRLDPRIQRAVESGELESSEGVDALVRELLTDTTSEATLARFFLQWLAIDGDLRVQDELADALRQETVSFGVATLQGEGSFSRLFNGRRATLDERLADHYGAAAGPDEEVPGRVGILTHGSVLAAHGRPDRRRMIHRGLFFREAVLCRTIDDVPQDVQDMIDAADYAPPEGDLSDRDVLRVETSGANCAYCHEKINPSGFAFELFDAQGRFREQDESGRALRAEYELRDSGDLDGLYLDHEDLMTRLPESWTAADCMARQWFRYLTGRVETDEDQQTIFDATEALLSAGELADAIASITRSDAFRYRRAPN